MKRLNLRMREQLYNVLKESSEVRGLSMNAMCILALETYLNQQTVIDNMDELLTAYREINKDSEN